MMEMRKRRFLVSASLLIVGIGLVLIGIALMVVSNERISLEDIRENPNNYLDIEKNGFVDLSASREILAEFTIVKITLRPDPSNRLWKTYYLVYINDTFGYELPFVISEDNLSRYEKHIGETALFKLDIYIGSELMQPLHFLITNILTVRESASLGSFYYVLISIAEPGLVKTGQLLSTYLLAVGMITAAAGAMLIASQYVWYHFKPTHQKSS